MLAGMATRFWYREFLHNPTGLDPEHHSEVSRCIEGVFHPAATVGTVLVDWHWWCGGVCEAATKLDRGLPHFFRFMAVKRSSLLPRDPITRRWPTLGPQSMSADNVGDHIQETSPFLLRSNQCRSREGPVHTRNCRDTVTRRKYIRYVEITRGWCSQIGSNPWRRRSQSVVAGQSIGPPTILSRSPVRPEHVISLDSSLSVFAVPVASSWSGN